MNLIKKLFVLCLLLTNLSMADEVGIKAGTGFLQDNENVSIYSLSYKYFLVDRWLVYSGEAGHWSDPKPLSRNSFYVHSTLGLRGELKGFWAEANVGGAIVANTDQYLGTAFEFIEEGSIGYKMIGASIRHYSNAGIQQPNLARNFILMGIYLPF